MVWSAGYIARSSRHRRPEARKFTNFAASGAHARSLHPDLVEWCGKVRKMESTFAPTRVKASRRPARVCRPGKFQRRRKVEADIVSAPAGTVSTRSIRAAEGVVKKVGSSLRNLQRFRTGRLCAAMRADGPPLTWYQSRRKMRGQHARRQQAERTIRGCERSLQCSTDCGSRLSETEARKQDSVP